MPVQPIRFGDDGREATDRLVARLDDLGLAPDHPLRGALATLASIDRQYGGGAALPLEDAPELVAAALVEAARHDRALGDGAPGAARAALADVALGVALWALRHDVAITFPEPVANALAVRSNLARSRQELAAAFGLMQGLIAHLAPRLEADLERSDPQRPWRVLHANFAITAIRTEDAALIEHAFDALDRALPGERASFYAEALALAMNPRVSPAVRAAIAARHAKWT